MSQVTAHTNVGVFKSIADSAHEEMTRLDEKATSRRKDGGLVKRFDPDQVSFKLAMVSVVFTGLWLEAFTHLLVVRHHGKETAAEYDRKVLERNLRLLGVKDDQLLKSVKRFRDARNELVHEKAHFDEGMMRTGQDEAQNAHEIRQAFEVFAKELMGGPATVGPAEARIARSDGKASAEEPETPYIWS